MTEDIVIRELEKMNVAYGSISLLREKDGVIVARVYGRDGSYVLKCFEKAEFRREIDAYRLLFKLHIPTLKMISCTDSAILMEDVNISPFWRLGVWQDMEDPETGRQIARWYKKLHENGREYAAGHGAGLYSELDLFTMENIEQIKVKTGTQASPAWKVLEDNFRDVCRKLRQLEITLTYNDFYYTNLAVARDNTAALMFDYNLLGKGYVYLDIHNVTFSLAPAARTAFLDEYGYVNPLEIAVDDIVSVVTTLVLACGREQFPDWANMAVKTVNTDYTERIERLLLC